MYRTVMVEKGHSVSHRIYHEEQNPYKASNNKVPPREQGEARHQFIRVWLRVCQLMSAGEGGGCWHRDKTVRYIIVQMWECTTTANT